VEASIKWAGQSLLGAEAQRRRHRERDTKDVKDVFLSPAD